MKELETHLLLAQRVGIAANGASFEAMEMADELGKMLGGLIRSIGKQDKGK